MKSKFILSISLAVGIFVVMLVLDLLSKHFVFQALPSVSDSMEVISGFFNFVHVENTGAAWGMLAGRPIFLIIVSIVILAVYLWFYIIRMKKHKGNTSIVLSISVGFIVGGCIGNLVDRIAFGYVRDFINLQFMVFPVFNVADISLTVGIILMLVYFIFLYSKEDKRYEMLMKDLAEFRDNSDIIIIPTTDSEIGEVGNLQDSSQIETTDEVEDKSFQNNDKDGTTSKKIEKENTISLKQDNGDKNEG